MLLPQSSAFAALKNRLNSVSAIGYIHIAPRTYVSSTITSLYHSRQKSSDAPPPSSNPSTPAVPNFERPNRLKAREEGGIRWQELLEKFKATQEKARRVQRGAAGVGDGADAVANTVVQIAAQEREKRTAVVVESGTKVPLRPGSAQSNGRPPPTPALGHAKAKSSLSNLGRFTSGVGGRKTKR